VRVGVERDGHGGVSQGAQRLPWGARRPAALRWRECAASRAAGLSCSTQTCHLHQTPIPTCRRRSQRTMRRPDKCCSNPRGRRPRGHRGLSADMRPRVGLESQATGLLMDLGPRRHDCEGDAGDGQVASMDRHGGHYESRSRSRCRNSSRSISPAA
jgi:hypothetical protein